MPMYDRMCVNGHQKLDSFEPVAMTQKACEECGAETSRVWISRASAVISDDIPGGVEIRNGLCNPDGTPRRYYSKTEMRQEAARRGLTNHVTHVTSPGTDKSRHTSRWI